VTPVEVWLAPSVDEAREDLASSLSPAERERAGRLQTAELRRRYVTSHAALRSVLALHTGTAPQDLEVARRPCHRYGSPHGKPFLPDHPRVSFNLAHSGDLALVAVAEGREIGVDLMRLAAATLAPSELRAIRLSESADPLTTFLAAWTRKEALLKACGQGIVGGLRDVAVPPLADGARTFAPGGRVPGTWTVIDLAPPPGYVASLAVEGGRPAVVTRWWAPSRPTAVDAARHPVGE
jgi:4'-phosphopantetheinyl transferase